MKTIKKNQMSTQELKSTLFDIKTLVEGFNNILEMVKEGEFEVQSIKIIQPYREKKD